MSDQLDIDDERGWGLIDQFAAGDVPEAERVWMAQWVVRTPAASAVIEALRKAQVVRDGDLVVFDVARVRGTMAIPGELIQPDILPVRRGRGLDWYGGRGRLGTRTLRRWGWYAAIGLVTAASGMVVGWQGRTRHFLNAVPSAMSTYTTGNGERANIVLPDGSTVALNVASRLDVPVDYATGNHTVRLLGEALFTVTRHEGMPFTVLAGTTTSQVLGTSFAVRHYATDTMTTVAVQDGKVAVGRVVVTALRLVEVGAHGVSHLRAADAERFGFATGVLTLPSMPLLQAIPELDRWYGVDIRLGDSSLAQVPIKGRFAGSLSDLAEFLEFLLNARVVRDGRVLTLFPKGR